jgi:hypothetical protein
LTLQDMEALSEKVEGQLTALYQGGAPVPACGGEGGKAF